MLPQVHITINPAISLKDPISSKLGIRIIEGSIDLLDAVGFEAFTFRKLAKHIGSTEASVYRYFESKHKLLLYLTCRYWGWTDYRLVLAISNVHDPCDRLNRAIDVLTAPIEQDDRFAYINEEKLNRIVIAESSKVYLTREVDSENETGVYGVFKQIVERVGDIILEINPDYRFPHMLGSTMIEGAHQQRFFAEHLPRLTDLESPAGDIAGFYKEMILKTITRS